MKGTERLVKQLVAEGAHYIFGRPGITEAGLLDAIAGNNKLQYISCLREDMAVAMADGYARATRHPAVVLLPGTAGLAGSMGMLYQAYRGHSPLVVLAGDPGVKYDAFEAHMYCDLVEMARPVTKWAGRVTDESSLLRLVRRAFRVAATPPAGPVLLDLPLDVMERTAVGSIAPSERIDMRVLPAGGSLLNQAAGILAGASKPLFIIGDGVAASGAVSECVTLAQMLGAWVYEADSSEVNFEWTSPLYGGSLGHLYSDIGSMRVEHADAVLVCGTYLFPEMFPNLRYPFRQESKIIHIDLDTYAIGKNYHVDVPICADPKLALQELASLVDAQLSDKKKESIQKSIQDVALARRERLAKKPFQGEPQGIFAKFCKALRMKAPGDTIIFDVAGTRSDTVTYYFTPITAGTYYCTRQSALGVGMPGAVGVRLANMESKTPVIAFAGDGASLHAIEALQTAARYGIDTKFVIINNGEYRGLKNNLDRYRKDSESKASGYPECYSLEPQVDFVNISESMNVPAMLLYEEKSAKEAAEWLLAQDGPATLEVAE